MSLVTVAEVRDALGIGALYDDAVIQACIDSAEALILPMLQSNQFQIVGAKLTSNIATLYTQQPHGLRIGQTITVGAESAPFNGTFALTAVTDMTVSYSKTNADVIYLNVVPHHVAGIAENYSTTQAVLEAITMTSCDIWQARTATNGQPVGIDFTPAPYRMGRSLLSRVSGLLAPYMRIGTLVG
jgi:hypothetical protein